MVQRAKDQVDDWNSCMPNDRCQLSFAYGKGAGRVLEMRKAAAVAGDRWWGGSWSLEYLTEVGASKDMLQCCPCFLPVHPRKHSGRWSSESCFLFSLFQFFKSLVYIPTWESFKLHNYVYLQQDISNKLEVAFFSSINGLIWKSFLMNFLERTQKNFEGCISNFTKCTSLWWTDQLRSSKKLQVCCSAYRGIRDVKRQESCLSLLRPTGVSLAKIKFVYIK